MAKYGTFKYGNKKYGTQPTPTPPPAPLRPKYKVGDILYEYILPQNSIPWYKNQMFVVKKYDPVLKQYTLTGTFDNYPRFYTQEMIDCSFRIWKKMNQRS
jgi:hypothetical protein